MTIELTLANDGQAYAALNLPHYNETTIAACAAILHKTAYTAHPNVSYRSIKKAVKDQIDSWIRNYFAPIVLNDTRGLRIELHYVDNYTRLPVYSDGYSLVTNLCYLSPESQEIAQALLNTYRYQIADTNLEYPHGHVIVTEDDIELEVYITDRITNFD